MITFNQMVSLSADALEAMERATADPWDSYITDRAMELAAEIRSTDIWDMDALAELCELADMAAAWEAAEGEAFEDVAYAAADNLGVVLI